MKNNLLKLSILAIATAASIPAFAAGEVGSGPNPYSDCGIGAALFKETAWAAATSNVTWDLGLTAITSATVSPETCTKRNIKAAMFIRDTYAQIVEDAARGNGEHLTAALEIFECSASKQHAAVNEVRSGMSNAVAKPGFNEQQHLEKAGQLFNIINDAARKNCSA
ncbi:MAG: DUF3015 family protein [Proteobacteria bacterium]|nr:DUF3015 family protein [Pseudomonadota bacterium]